MADAVAVRDRATGWTEVLPIPDKSTEAAAKSTEAAAKALGVMCLATLRVCAMFWSGSSSSPPR